MVIDGLFGSGLNRPLTGGFAAMVNYINQSEAEVVAIDIPSGLFGEDNRKNDSEAIIKASLTLTFGFPKLAFLFPENEQYVGEWKILDIGIHPDAIYETASPYSLVTEEDISYSLKSRKRFAHKGTFGHALLIAGSKGKMGAALLSAKACLRSGAGLLTVHIPTRGESIFQTAFPEAMLRLDANPDYFSTVPEIGSYSAVGMGPGLGQHLESAAAIERILQSSTKPVVIDADAINIMASNKDLFNKIPPRSILTPHPKEFDRLAGNASSSCTERLMKASELAERLQAYIILKGHYSALCHPDGKIDFCTTGNSGMATAGSGDVLTGIITGLLARGYKQEDACRLGMHLHGLAGDLAAKDLGKESLIASDIIQYLPKAFLRLEE